MRLVAIIGVADFLLKSINVSSIFVWVFVWGVMALFLNRIPLTFPRRSLLAISNLIKYPSSVTSLLGTLPRSWRSFTSRPIHRLRRLRQAFRPWRASHIGVYSSQIIQPFFLPSNPQILPQWKFVFDLFHRPRPLSRLDVWQPRKVGGKLSPRLHAER